MRILIINDFYPPFIGGVERQIRLLGQQLARRGHTVDVATVWHTGQAEYELDGDVGVYRLKAFTTQVPWFSQDPGRRFHPPFPDPLIVWKLRRLMLSQRYEVVHVAGWMAYSAAVALWGLKAVMLVSIRDYSYTCATRVLLYGEQMCDGPALLKCLACAQRTYGVPKALAAVLGVGGGQILLLHRTNAWHAISSFTKTIIERDLILSKKLGWKRGKEEARSVNVIPSFRDDAEEELPETEFLARLPAEPYLLYVGALRRQKGLETLMAAYKQLSSPPPLVLIGAVWPETPKEFPPGVIVLTDVSHSNVMAAWERCLFAIAPSLWPEPFGGVIHEAMSKGKAVIASHTGGIVDMVIPGETGLLVPPGDVTALAEAMQQLIDNPDYRERLGQAGQNRAVLFTTNVVVPRFEQLYQQMII